MSSVADYQTTIASAVEEQAETIHAIAGDASQAAGDSEAIADGVDLMSRAMSAQSQNEAQIGALANRLSGITEAARGLLDDWAKTVDATE